MASTVKSVSDIQNLIDILMMALTGKATVEDAKQCYNDRIEAYIRLNILNTLNRTSVQYASADEYSEAYDSLYTSEKMKVEHFLAENNIRTTAITESVRQHFPEMRVVHHDNDVDEYEQIIKETPFEYKVKNIFALENTNLMTALGTIGYYSPRIRDVYDVLEILSKNFSLQSLNGDTHLWAHAGWWRNYATKFWCNLVLFRTITFDSGHILYTHVITVDTRNVNLFQKLHSLTIDEKSNPIVPLTFLSSSPSASYIPKPMFPIPQIPESTKSGISPIAETPAFFYNCICPISVEKMLKNFW